jgi:MraZ protein
LPADLPAIDVELDNAGRLLIPVNLREDARLEREVTLMGVGGHLELWRPEMLRELEERDLADGLPEAAAGFSF